MKLFFAIILSLSISQSYCQLAKLTFTDEQKYRLNLNRGGGMIVTPFSKAIRSYNMSSFISNPAGGYVRFEVIKGASGSTKNGPYIQVMKLDDKLTIKSTQEAHLFDDNGEIMPVGAFQKDGTLNLLTAGPGATAGSMRVAYTEINLADISIGKKNTELFTIPFDEKKEFDFSVYQSPDKKNIAINILQDGGKKESPKLYCMSFDDKLKTLFKQEVILPWKGEDGILVKTLVSQSGKVISLLNTPHEKRDEIMVSSVLIVSAAGSQTVSLQYGNDPLVNCVLNQSATGNLLIGGLTWPSKKEYSKSFVFGSISTDGKLEGMKEEIFSTDLLKKLTNADDDKGVKTNYHVRSVTERQNGMMDIVLDYSLQEFKYSSPQAGSTRYYNGEIGDMVVFTYNKGQLISTMTAKRTMWHKQPYGAWVKQYLKFTIPEVFVSDNDLFLMYYDSPGNMIGEIESKKGDRIEFNESTLVLTKIDKNFKVVRQELIQLEKKGDFSSPQEINTTEVAKKVFIVSTDKYKIFSKDVKTFTVLVDVK